MQFLKCVVVVLCILTAPAFAADVKPTEESVKKLLKITDSRNLTNEMRDQVGVMMNMAMQEMLKGRGQPVTLDQLKILKNMNEKIEAEINKEMTWEKLEPITVSIYRNSFTQEEVNGMLAFFQTPSGQAVIKKMPVVMQNSMAEMQKQMGPLMLKLQKIEQETVAELSKTSP